MIKKSSQRDDKVKPFLRKNHPLEMIIKNHLLGTMIKNYFLGIIVKKLSQKDNDKKIVLKE